mgnify:CR=1 FL=1
MDVLKFLQGGNKTPNPEYNPKTKKGSIQPPTLVDYTPEIGRAHVWTPVTN